MAALFTAHHLEVKAIAALTQSGSTALWMSRLDCGVPIFALTPEEGTRRRLSLYRDVRTLLMTYHADDREKMLHEAEEVLLRAGVVERGDLIVMTIGEPIGKSGGTNTMKIVRVGEHG
jgi:pyruvate kinase